MRRRWGVAINDGRTHGSRVEERAGVHRVLTRRVGRAFPSHGHENFSLPALTGRSSPSGQTGQTAPPGWVQTTGSKRRGLKVGRDESRTEAVE